MYTRQRIVDHSDFSIKQINDNFSAIFLKLSGNIDTIDMKDGAITGKKIAMESISIGHLDSEFILNFPLLDNPTFISYSESVDNNFSEQATLIQQNGEQISLHATNISNLKTDFSNLSVRADKIESNVSSIQSDVSNHSSQITQLSDSFSSKVSYTDYNGVEIASLINQEASKITISAEAIDLTGVTKLYNPTKSGSYAEFYGSTFSLYYDNESFFKIHIDAIIGTDIYNPGSGPLRFKSFSNFEKGVSFSDSVDFSNANIIGLNVVAKFA